MVIEILYIIAVVICIISGTLLATFGWLWFKDRVLTFLRNAWSLSDDILEWVANKVFGSRGRHPLDSTKNKMVFHSGEPIFFKGRYWSRENYIEMEERVSSCESHRRNSFHWGPLTNMVSYPDDLCFARKCGLGCRVKGLGRVPNE